MSGYQILSALTFLSFAALGVLLGAHSWKGTFFVHIGDPRSPAAVPKQLDFSNLKGVDLSQLSKEHMLKQAKVVQKPNAVGVSLGHFVMTNSKGEKAFACDLFQKLEMTFAAQGMAESGARPTLQMKGPCRPSSDMKLLEPLWLSTSHLKRVPLSEHFQSVGDQRLHPSSALTQVKFKNLHANLPTEWSLIGIRLLSTQGKGPKLSLNHHDLIQMDPQPLTIQTPQ